MRRARVATPSLTQEKRKECGLQSGWRKNKRGTERPESALPAFTTAHLFLARRACGHFPWKHFVSMKVLVADKISPKGVAYLRQQPGIEVVEAYGSSPEKVLELVKDVHAISVRSETKITAAVFKAAPHLKVVGRAGVGVDNVDVEAATNHGVVVMNTPAGNTIATAELTFTHILCGARPVPQAAGSMKAGQWDRKSFSGIELFRKTLGIVGLGRIGGEVAKRAQAFGMRVLA